MGDTLEYSDIHQEIRGCMNPGRLKLQSNTIIFKNMKTGKVDQFNASDVESAQWLTRARGYCLKIIFSNDTIQRFDGLKEAEYERLAPFFEKNYNSKLEQVNLALKGWNWGISKFTANALDFEVDGKMAFEIPLGNVSNSVTSKNEVTVEFHPNDDAPVSLMELRFHIPGVTGEDTDDPVQEFYNSVISKADIIQATGDAVVTFQEVQCLTPRGRYDIKVYQSFIQLHGKTFDYKIPHTTILRLFLLPHRDGRQMFLAISLDPPIKQGQTRYPFLILLFNIEDEITLNLALSDEDIESKYENKLEKEMSGLEYEVIARVMKTVVNRKITATGNFKGHSGTHSIACSYKAATGFLYPLDRGFIFIHKPPMHIRFDEIATVNFARSSGSTTRSFDFEIETKGNNNYVFVGIEKDEYGKLYDYVTGKKLRVKNVGEKGMKSSYADDMEGSDTEGKHDAYLERMKAEGKDRHEDDLDDDTDSSDESFNPGESGSEVAEEYDTDAASSSSSSEEDSNEDPEARKQRKDARRAEKEAARVKTVVEKKPRKKKTTSKKKQKDPDRPTRPSTAFMIWLNASREAIKAEFPGIAVTEIAKKGGERWRELTDKTEWEGKANEAKERYKAAMEVYNAKPKDDDDDDDDDDDGGKSAKPRKKKASGSPKKAVAANTTSAGAGGSFKSKEFISSSDSSGGEGKPKKKKAKKEKVKQEKADSEESEDDEDFKGDGSDESEEEEEKEKKPKGRRISKRGKPGGEIKEEAEEFAGLPSDEEILASGSGSDEGPPSVSGSDSASASAASAAEDDK